jgi:nicotinamidase-related amidase
MRARTLLLTLACAALLTSWGVSNAQEPGEKEEIKPVLLVIDVQNAYMPFMSPEDRASAPARINEAIALFREYGSPVIRVYHTDPKRGPEPGTKPFEFADSIAVTDADVQVIKNHPSAFTKTDLEEILLDSGRNTVFLCGLSAVGCVLATYFGALDRDFQAFMVDSALLSHNASYTKMVEDITYGVSLDELKEVLQDPRIINR